MHNCLIVIPCFNEAKRLLVNEFVDFANKNNHFSFLFVNDGSTDDTQKVLAKICNNTQLTYISQETNKGKAESVRLGINEGLKNKQHHYFAYLDADLAIPLDEFERLFQMITSNQEYQLTFFSKIPQKELGVRLPFKRYFIGRVLAMMNKMSLKLPIYDTQCGCKIMTRDTAELVVKEPFISSWLFDIEIFWRLISKYNRKYIHKHTLEVPLNKLVERGSSSINLVSLFKLPFEYLKIHLKYRKK